MMKKEKSLPFYKIAPLEYAMANPRGAMCCTRGVRLNAYILFNHYNDKNADGKFAKLTL